MLFAEVLLVTVVTLGLGGESLPDQRLHLLDDHLKLAFEPRVAMATGKCPALFPPVPMAPDARVPAEVPADAVKRSLGGAFRGHVSTCTYGPWGRRQDPRFGSRQLTVELPAPFMPKAPVRLLLRTVVGRFERIQDFRHNRAEVYAGFGLL